MEAIFKEASEVTPTMVPIEEKVLVSTSALHLKRKRAKAPMVVSKVGRSDNLKDKNQGYKAEPCIDRQCLCCAIVPPTLSSRVIKSPERDFCKILVSKLPKEDLNGKATGKKNAIGKISKAGKSGKTKSKINEDTK
jgi:hypothetical protein